MTCIVNLSVFFERIAICLIFAVSTMLQISRTEMHYMFCPSNEDDSFQDQLSTRGFLKEVHMLDWKLCECIRLYYVCDNCG
jgi:hypothetical protein